MGSSLRRSEPAAAAAARARGRTEGEVEKEETAASFRRRLGVVSVFKATAIYALFI